ncbi:MAG: hypothetical protein K9J13_10385 [Saprospiraceae bacterium]|nr:hypothetical protein [Saprospiraceae bacterium]
MKPIDLRLNNRSFEGSIFLPSSKSISNRALIISALCDNKFQINNLSEADDTKLLNFLLEKIKKTDSKSKKITELDAKNSGTTFRFLTAYLTTIEGKWLLTGSERMKQRPIGILADALKELGAKITYNEKNGFPPLLIEGQKLETLNLKPETLNLKPETLNLKPETLNLKPETLNLKPETLNLKPETLNLKLETLNLKPETLNLKLQTSVSSQFITALLLIAPTLKQGLEIELEGKIASEPFLDMTIKMMKEFGIEVLRENNSIEIKNQNYTPININIESDWTSASYWYEIVAFSTDAKICLPGLKKNSLQGDSIIARIFKNFGVHTEYHEDHIILKKTYFVVDEFNYDFSNCPDLAQTVAVTCAGLNINAELSGLENLKHKETDRLYALHSELHNCGYNSEIKDNSKLLIHKPEDIHTIRNSILLNTYDDHRMALAFAPLVVLNKSLIIQDSEVVNKSYPGFWEDLKALDIIE